MSKTEIQVLANRHYNPGRFPAFLCEKSVAPVHDFYRTVPEYKPTELVRLDGLARALHVKAVFVKDESKRFGLKAFKGLGGLYAVVRTACSVLGLETETVTLEQLRSEENAERLKEMTFVTATDGNHGKGVAWAAGLLGCKAYVYMPKGSSEARAQAIRDAGKAEAFITEMGYDDTVRLAASLAEKNGWHLVQDTSWEGYEEIPSWIIQGYTTMAAEAVSQLEAEGFSCPTHVFVQAGVGAMAGGVTGYLANRYQKSLPVFVTVEPDDMACVYASVQSEDGTAQAVTNESQTIMAGLNCGEPCTITWPILRDHVQWSAACSNQVAALGMRILAAPLPGDPVVVSGESGAVTTGFLALLAHQPEYEELRSRMGLNENSVVLLFSTEGDTDPERYRSIVYGGHYPFRQE